MKCSLCGKQKDDMAEKVFCRRGITAVLCGSCASQLAYESANYNRPESYVYEHILSKIGITKARDIFSQLRKNEERDERRRREENDNNEPEYDPFGENVD